MNHLIKILEQKAGGKTVLGLFILISSIEDFNSSKF